MTVVHIITDLDVGGAEMMLLKIASQHQRTGISCRVINLLGAGPIEAELKKNNIPVLNLEIQKPFRFFQKFPTVLSWVRKANVIQAWMYHGNLFASFFSAFRPVVWNVRQSLSQFASEKRFLREVILWNCRLSRLPRNIIYNSDLARSQHENLGFDSGKSVVLGNGFDTDIFRPQGDNRNEMRKLWKLNETHFLIAHVGRYHRDKDHRSFILAGLEFLKDHPETRFILAGRGVDVKNTELVNLIPAEKRDCFFFLGETKDIPALLGACDVYTSSSVAEAFSNSIGEAMACALPCVVTNVGDSEKIIGDPSWVVPAGHPEELVRKWTELRAMPAEQRTQLGARFRTRLIENYSLTRIANQYEELYRGLVK